MPKPSNDIALNHLTVPISGTGKVNHFIRQVILKILAIPGTIFCLRGMNRLVEILNNTQRAQALTQIHIEAARMQDQGAHPFGIGSDYDKAFKELECAEHYRQELHIGNWDKQKTDSGDIYAEIIPLVSNLIQQNHITNVLNYGVAYAYTDSTLAQKFPQTQLIGVGRHSSLIKYFNEQFFSLPNLEFSASNIFDILDTRCQDNTLIIHARAMSCMTPAFAKEFYKKLGTSSCRHIVLAEPTGISWETNNPYVFSYTDQPSVALRNYMYIHNYPGLLQRAGFKINHSTLLKTAHPDPNFRFVVIAASKVQ